MGNEIRIKAHHALVHYHSFISSCIFSSSHARQVRNMSYPYCYYNQNTPYIMQAMGYAYPPATIPVQPPSYSAPSWSAPQTSVPVLPPNQYQQAWPNVISYSPTDLSGGYLYPPPASGGGLRRSNAVHGKMGEEVKVSARASRFRSGYGGRQVYTVSDYWR